MENASEALRIAGAVLIGVLLLALLIAFYNNMSSYNKLKDNLEYSEQVSDFNKKYDIYIKNLYGSELLSLVNMAADYNKLQAQEEGYPRLEVEIKFTSNYGKISESNFIFKKNKIYITDTIISNMNGLQSNINEAGNIEHAKYKVKKLALLREEELLKLYEKEELDSTEIENANEAIERYTELKADQVTIKSKIYKYDTSEYDKKTGRLKKITYIEQ